MSTRMVQNCKNLILEDTLVNLLQKDPTKKHVENFFWKKVMFTFASGSRSNVLIICQLVSNFNLIFINIDHTYSYYEFDMPL